MENRTDYTTDTCHDHSRDDFGEVPFWKRAAVTEGQYRALLRKLAEVEAELAKTIEYYNEEVRQFNLGHDAAYAGASNDDVPQFEIDTDQWRIGWVWGMWVKGEWDSLLADNIKVKAERDALKVEMRQMDLLRLAGCRCENPLIGYRPDAGPRCRLCNVVADENSTAVHTPGLAA